MGLLCGLMHYLQAGLVFTKSGTVTVGGGLGAQAGYSNYGPSGLFGSFSGDLTVAGKTPTYIATPGVTVDFYIGYSDPGAEMNQNDFSAVRVEDGTGVKRIYEVADVAFFGNDGGLSIWYWGVGSDPVWSYPADDGEMHSVEIAL